MSKKIDTHARTLKMVQLAFFTALVIVLQLMSYYIKIGTFSMSLVLIPIMIGGAAFGVGAGAFLGGVFGIVTLIAGIAGLDAGTLALFQLNGFTTSVIAIGKALLAGLISALVYKAMRKACKKYTVPAAIAGAVVTPIVNTSLFCIGMLLFFNDTLTLWAGGASVSSFVFFGLVGVNFLIELGLNIVICPILIKVLSGSKSFKGMF